jgi:phage repressor protein C with HTH and peptisase S24 domain
VAVELGFRTQQAVSHIECGRSSINADRIAPAARLLGVSADYLLGITDDPTPADQRSSNRRLVTDLTNGVRDNALVPRDAPSARPIPIRELAAAAGGDAVDLDETIVGYLYFRREWLDRQAIDSTQADVIQVRGESMEPTLPDGCSILMDRRQRAPRSGRVYVVRTDEGIVVKRARRDGGRWILSSDHPAWPPRPWPADAELIGEVRWMARNF